MVLVVGNHSSRYLQYGSLREVNVPFIGVRAPVAKNLDKPRGWASGSCCRGCPNSETVGVVVIRLKATQLK